MNYVFLFMHYSAMADLLAQGDGKAHFELQAGRSLAQLLMSQERREALPPLPQFPDQPQLDPRAEAIDASSSDERSDIRGSKET
jgi:hypothetical protein